MSSKVSIPVDVVDNFYRYKRDLIQVVYENKNGVQTRMVNIDLISRQLKIPRDDIPKAIKRKLGVSINKDTIPGRIEVSQLESVLNVLIEDKVLCKKCRLPELSDDTCNACGTPIASQEPATRKPKIKSNPIPDTEENDSELEPSDIELKVVKIMHELYAVREQFLPTRDSNPMSKVILAEVDKYLARCWPCNTKQGLRSIRADTKAFGIEIEANLI